MLAARLQPYLYAAIALATLAAFAAYDLERERERSVAEAKANTANLARLIEQQALQWLRRGEAALNDFEARQGAQGGPGPSPLPEDGLVGALLELDVDGRVLRSTLRPGAGAQAEAGFVADWQPRLASAAGRLAVGKPWRQRDGNWVVPVGRSAGAGSAERRDLVALLSLAAWQPVLDGVDTGRNGFVTLFLRDGSMLATSPRNDALLERNWLNTPMFQEHLPRAPAGTVQQVVVRDRTERIYSYRALADYPLVVSAGISMTDALIDWRARIVSDALLLAIVAGAALWGAAVLSRNYARREAAEGAAAQARESIERSERFLREITDNLPLRIAYVDRELRYRFVNQAHCLRFGRPRENVLGCTDEELTGRPLPDEWRRRIGAVLEGQTQRFELEEPDEGHARVMESFLVPDRGPDGRVQGFYAAGSDVTERHTQRRHIEQALAERETLLREVYHRVKNNLQVIQSLLNLQRRTLPEGPARAALDDSVQRVHAMALVHEKLYQADDLEAVALPDYIADLLRYLGDSADAARRGIRLLSEVQVQRATLASALPLGLIVTELVANSLKHGFPAGQQGTVRVRLTPEDGVVRLEVEDDGVGLAAACDPARPDSLGLQLVTSLAAQLGGAVQVAPGPGARFTLGLARFR